MKAYVINSNRTDRLYMTFGDDAVIAAQSIIVIQGEFALAPLKLPISRVVPAVVRHYTKHKETK